MSKIRVYELAKELGLENKALLDLCQQLGMDDKASHSNSLSDDEADRIRRSVIRRAVSDRSGAVREVSKEGQLLTESRLGSNVIRRRKKTAEEEEAAAAAAAAAPTRFVDVESEIQQSYARDLPSLTPDPVADRLSRAQALREADALFGPRPTASETSAEDSDDESQHSDDESVKPAARAAAGSAEALESDVEESEDDEVDDGSDVADESENDGEAADGDLSSSEFGASATDALVAVGEGLDAAADAENSASIAAGQEHAAGQERLAEVRRRHDIRAPRVLGKIELPVKVVPPTKKAAPAAGENGTYVNGEADSKTAKKKVEKRGAKVGGEATDEASELAKKRPKKKQVLRKDELLDYDGERENWRTRKDKKKKGDHGAAQQEAGPTKLSKKVLKIAGQITVGELAKQMSVKVNEVIPHLMSLGIMAGINQPVDLDTATVVAAEFGFTTQNTSEDVEDVVSTLNFTDSTEQLEYRPPVVTVMGHVDHGKTSLLDAIRATSVTKGEFGGITQHIGAYTVRVPSGGLVTFLDTPGHEAFTAMRSRGAKVTDIVVLVVAADDGVMPQTIEAINHAKAAEVPIIVAVNKIDKEGANPEKVINQLSEHGLIPEEWGGDTIIVHVSAHTRQGLDLLLENLHLQAEILELKANPNRRAHGTVIESKLDKGRGPVITVLVQNGTLRKGDIFITGSVYGRVRALVRDDGEKVDEVGPSIPVEVLGSSAAPLSGDDFMVVESEAQARRIADLRSQGKRQKGFASADSPMTGALTLERFSAMVGTATDMKELPLIVKADVQGSVEAVADALSQLGNEEVRVRVIHRGVGAITENDVQLASASNAVIVGFNVRADTRATVAIAEEGVEVLYSRIIYELVDEVEKAIQGKRAPKFQEKTLGRVEVRQTFKVPKLGMVAGSYVLDGVVTRGSQVRLLRDNRVVYEGKMGSLRRFKDDVREVQAGYECGIGIEGYSDIKDGDIIEVFKIEEVRPS